MFNQRPDPEIARDAVAAIRSELPYSSEHIRVVVREGWLTLEGTVEWNYAKERAESAVKRVRGVKGLRIVDASVLPTLPRGGLLAPVIALAERAADLIAGRAPLVPVDPEQAAPAGLPAR